MERPIDALEDTKAAAKELYRRIEERAAGRSGAAVVGLYGDLGAGKTAFSKLFAELLGIEAPVTSPTFVIQKIYPVAGDAAALFDHFIHIDAYRLGDAAELARLGWDAVVADPRNVVFVEWPERVASIMPAHDAVRLSLDPEGKRTIAIAYA